MSSQNIESVGFNSSETSHVTNIPHSVSDNFPLETLPNPPTVFSTKSNFLSSNFNYPLLLQNELKPPEIFHSNEPEVETTLPFKKRRKMSIYVEAPNRKEYESCEILQSTKSPGPLEIVEPCNRTLKPNKETTSYPSTPMISIATIAHLLHENHVTNAQHQNLNTHSFEVPNKAQNHFNNVLKANVSPQEHFYHENHQMQRTQNTHMKSNLDYHNFHVPEPIGNNNFFKSIDYKSGLQHSLAGSGNIQSNSRGIILPSSSRHQEQSNRDHNLIDRIKTKSSSKRTARHARKSTETKEFDLNDEFLRKGDKVASKKYQMIKKIILKKPMKKS